MSKRISALTALLLIFSAFSVCADEAEKQLQTKYLALFPKPPAGWEAREGAAQTAQIAMVGGGTQLTREYFRDGEQVTITMIANASMLRTLNVIFNNPAMLAGNPNTQPYSYKDYKGIKKQVGNGVEISLLVGHNTLVQLKGSNLKEDKVLEGFLDGMDLKKIEQLIAS